LINIPLASSGLGDGQERRAVLSTQV